MSSIVSTLIAAAQTRRQDGQAMVEYGLILALVSVVAIGTLTTVGTSVDGIFGAVGGALGAVPLP